MSTAVMTNSLPRRWQLSSVANTTLKVAARSWFVVTVVGQLFFAFAIARLYTLTALRGDYHGCNFTHGFMPGVTKGKCAVVMHVASAALIMLAGAAQLVPHPHRVLPVVHTCTTRIYMLAAVPLMPPRTC